MQHTNAIILCGGMGTRLRPVLSDRPKPLAPVGNGVFLDVLISFFAGKGVTKFILSTGYKKEMIKAYVEKQYGWRKDLSFAFSEEEKPLGTGGAFKKALRMVPRFPCMAANGDSFLNIDLSSFFTFHREKQALFSMALTSEVRDDGGSVAVDDTGKIIEFREKTKTKTASYINGGVYICGKTIMEKMPDQEAFSLEYDFFPGLVKEGLMYGFPVESEVMDIGTPDRYRTLQGKLASFLES